MIQELISTSVPRCLNGNAGFGIVVQTSGMVPNVSQAINAFSGYTHIAASGSGRNPVVYLHATRRTGGVLQHIVSRIADCGNDYTGRSNRIAHHLIIDEGETRSQSMAGGPAELVAQNIFNHRWNDRPTELPPKKLSVPDVSPKRCDVWERLTGGTGIGDTGWGGIVAERAEKGDSISIIFSHDHNSDDLRALIGEALTLLPPLVRWRITFSTYYMNSQESGDDRIQIKCLLADSVDASFAWQSSLVIDLRHHHGRAPDGQYVELARRGEVKQSSKGLPNKKKLVVPVSVPLSEPEETYEMLPNVGVPRPLERVKKPQVPGKNPLLDYTTGRDFSGTKKSSNIVDPNWFMYLGTLIAFVIILLGIVVFHIVSTFKSESEKANLRADAATSKEKCKVAEDGKKQLKEELERKSAELEKAEAEKVKLQGELTQKASETEKLRTDWAKTKKELAKARTKPTFNFFFPGYTESLLIYAVIFQDKGKNLIEHLSKIVEDVPNKESQQSVLPNDKKHEPLQWEVERNLFRPDKAKKSPPDTFTNLDSDPLLKTKDLARGNPQPSGPSTTPNQQEDPSQTDQGVPFGQNWDFFGPSTTTRFGGNWGGAMVPAFQQEIMRLPAMYKAKGVLDRMHDKQSKNKD